MASPPPREQPVRVTRTEFGLEFSKIGASRFDLADPYHTALSVRAWTFAAGILFLYGAITSLFAGLYLLRPGCVANVRPGSVSDAFFFSIETLATVGYGSMYPATLYGHLVSSAEIVAGMGFTAIVTGLIFVRFSKAKAKLVYSDVAVITRHNGRPTLMLRIGNARTSVLTQVSVTLNALVREVTAEGNRYRRLQELPLLRSTAPIFPLVLTLMHDIDDASPLHGFDSEALDQSDISLILGFEGRDPGLSAVVHDIKVYRAADLRLGMRFSDIVNQREDGVTVADLTRIDAIEAEDAAE